MFVMFVVGMSVPQSALLVAIEEYPNTETIRYFLNLHLRRCHLLFRRYLCNKRVIQNFIYSFSCMLNVSDVLQGMYQN